MKTASELYASDIDDTYFSIWDYQPMLDSFGEIVLQVDDNDYQGDSRVLYKDGGKYGWLQFGWGSCSGCDSLQNCDNIEEVQELMDELNSSIKWFDSSEECYKYFSEKDWSMDYSWHREEQKEFIERVKQLTKKEQQ